MHAVEDERHQSPREKLLAVEREISERVFEREEEIRGFTVGLLARAHVLFLGPKGCAKSSLAQLLCGAAIWEGIPEGREAYFDLQLARDSLLDELFGPISSQGFEEDTFRRNMSGMLTEAKIVLLEEAYKANSTVLNRLLTIMNEGVHRNGTDPKKPVPLRLLVATSNKLPDDREDNLDAFHDRFMLRYEVDYLKDPKNIRKMMEKSNQTRTEEPPLAAAISEAELDEACEEVACVDVSPVFDAIDDILARLADHEIHPSDRRRAALVGLVKAQAYLSGRTEATREDLCILAHALWEDPDQITEVRRLVLGTANPHAARAQDLYDAVCDSHAAAMKAHRAARDSGTEEDREAETGAGMNANTALRNACQKLFELSQTAKECGADSAPIDDLLEKTAKMNQEVSQKCLGI